MSLHRKVDQPGQPDVDINPIYVQEAGHEVPRHTMPRRGMLPATALQVVQDELFLADLRRHCRALAASYKVPDRIEMCDVLPVTTTGKLLRRELKQMAAAAVEREAGTG